MSNIVKLLREEQNLSQDELASALGITRQTLSKYENENCNLSLDIIKKLARFFDVDYSCFIDNKMPVRTEYNIVGKSVVQPKTDIRINIPQENIDKFKQVLLYILNKVGAKPNVGQTVIYKLLYFIDFDFYELYEEQLMGLKYIKNTYGPTPVDFAKLIKEMENNGDLEEVKTKYFNREQTKYLPIKKADLSLLSALELEHIDKELERLSDKTGKELSEFSHKDIPWIGTEMGETLEYEAVFYRTNETSLREYDEENA
nr:MAG TPA: helix-turn-helix domain protein [Caudoviricetes sp.]